MNQDKQAVYYIKPTGEVIRISDDFQKPNGLYLSLDEKLLYVDDWSDKYVSVFDVQDDGTAINKRVFCTLKTSGSSASSGADGMKIDSEGTFYVATSLGIQVINKEWSIPENNYRPEPPIKYCLWWKRHENPVHYRRTKSVFNNVDIPGNSLTSFKELSMKSQLVYPNPTKGKVQFRTGSI